MIYQTIINIAMGFMTGYITNKYAIDMLFEKKFGLGGVILKKHKEFANNFAVLVEKDLINQHYMQREIKKPAVRRAVRSVFFYTFDVTLLNKLKILNMKASEVPSIDGTFNNFVRFADENSKAVLPEILLTVLKHTDIKDILSEKQAAYIAATVTALLVEMLNDKAEIYTKDIFDEIKHIKPKDVLTSEVCEILMDSFLSSVNQTKQLKGTDEFLDSLFDIPDFQDLLKEMEISFKNRKLRDVLNANSDKNFKKIILELLDSTEFEKHFTKLLSDALTYLKSSDMKIANLLGKDLEKKLYEYISVNLPDVLESIIKFIRDKQGKIEHIIDSSIDEHLRSSSFAGVLKSFLKEYFIGNMPKKFQLIDEIISQIESYESDKHLPQRLTQSLIKYLQNKNIADIINDLQKSGLIDANLISKIIIKTLKQFMVKTDVKLPQTFLAEKRVKDVVDFELSRFIKTYVKNWIYFQRSINFISKKLDDKIKNLLGMSIGEINIHPKKTSNVLLKLIQENRKKLYISVLDRINSIDSSTLKDERVVNSLNVFIHSELVQLTKQLSGEIKQRDLSYVGSQVKKHSNCLADNLTNLLLDILYENMSSILKGKVSCMIRQQMLGYTPEVIRDKVQDFMGKELKPITLFGAGLGMISGLSIYLLNYHSGMEVGYYSLAVNPLIYAFTGIATNWIAIKMLFRPYHEKRILNIKIPLTPGVVGKNKARFAKSTADFICQELLSVEFLKRKIRAIDANTATKYIANNDKMIFRFLKNNARIFGERMNLSLVNYCFFYLDKENLTISRELVDKIRGFKLKNIYILCSKDVELLLRKEANNLSDALIKYLFKTAKSKKTLAELLPDEIVAAIDKEIKSAVKVETDKLFFDFLDILKSEHKFKKSLLYLINFDNIKHKKLNEVLSERLLYDLKHKLAFLILDKIKSTKPQSLLKILNDVFYHSNKTNGVPKNLNIITRFIYTNIDYLSRELTELFLDGASKLLIDNRNNIIKAAKKNITQKSLLMRFANFILDIDYDIKNVVDDLVYYKIPSFLSSESKKIQSFVKKFLESQIKHNKKNVELLNNAFENIAINTFENLLKEERLQFYIEKFLVEILDELSKIRIKTIFDLIDVNSLQGILKLFKNEIDILQKTLILSMENNRGHLLLLLNNFLSTALITIILNIKASDLFYKIDEGHIRDMLNKVSQVLRGSNTADRIISDFAESTLSSLENKTLQDIVNLELLKGDLVGMLKKLTQNNNLKHEINIILQPLTVKFVASLNDLIANPTKDFVMKISICSIINAVHTHADTLVKSVDVRSIVERAINDMNPKEVEDMFESFAENYLKRLVLYGGIGGVFGIPSSAVLFYQLHT